MARQARNGADSNNSLRSMKIAVIGAGSSGLVTLKYLLEVFPTADIQCFEKTQSIRGCWGNQRDDFISTSTKYTTQFSCFRKFKPDIDPTQQYGEFYRGGEFGDYLEDFADHFGLRQHINFGMSLESFSRINQKWQLQFLQDNQMICFDALFICTGLVNQAIPLDTPIPVADNPEKIRNKTVVVVGGGESASDIANHLADPKFRNTVYLSLRSGIRVSPRYHPIKGVPSDFLRNRLLLAPSQELRNYLGELFVDFRIRYQKILEYLFPQRSQRLQKSQDLSKRRKFWDLKLKLRAKGKLFNVFHNKSDDFLDAVAEERLYIIGEAQDKTWHKFWDFDGEQGIEIAPDVLVPATGYSSRLKQLSHGKFRLSDFYHGCVHVDNNNLFLIGFARPIIGNIPSISEMQARYTIGVLAESIHLPKNVKFIQERIWQDIEKRYPSINIDNVYPVEQYPYSDILAREMGIMLSPMKVLPSIWLKTLLVTANTSHYLDEFYNPEDIKAQRIYTPVILNTLLAIITVCELLGQWIKNRKFPS